MPQEIMTQDEIDALMQNISTGEFENPAAQLGVSTLNPDDVRYRYNDIVACKARYEYALTNCGFKEIEEAARNLRRAGFANWLLRRGFSNKEDYYRFMNNEAIKKGMPQPFKRYVLKAEAKKKDE
jgi:hypothetical protein